MQQLKGAELGPLSPEERREEAYQLRIRTAGYYRAFRNPVHRNNGDEAKYQNENYYANYSKGLPHDNNGEVSVSDYRRMLQALDSGLQEDFEAIPPGAPGNFTKLTDPQCGLAFDLEGIDPHQITMPPCYSFDSEDAIGEIAENYWMAVCRDVPFSGYGEAKTLAAASDLNNFAAFHGPVDPGSSQVTLGTLFRGNTKDDLVGPFLSQFLLADVPYGSQVTPAKVAFAVPQNDYMLNEAEYLAAQNGQKPAIVPLPVGTPTYMHSGRDLANYVHIDELFQAYLNACLVLITPQNRGGFGAPVSMGNPYFKSKIQAGFGTLGEPNFKTMVAEVATRALKAVWFQKWYVHRRLRPEVFAARIHWHLANGRTYDFHAAEFTKLQNGVLTRPELMASSSFLPMAFPEGSPTHPSYGAGHATVAGACVTILKALFPEEMTLTQLGITPMQPNSDGTALVPYAGTDADQMTIGGELNKLAGNISLARNFAGVHWRSDHIESLKLGEQVALWFLTDYVQTYQEYVNFRLTRFDGTQVTIQNGFMPMQMM